MKRALTLVLGLGVLCGAVTLLPGCSTANSVRNVFLKGNVLTYEQYLSVDQNGKPTPTADSVVATLGMPMQVHDRGGIRRRIDYHSYSFNGDLKVAEFTFDENEKLVKKELW